MRILLTNDDGILADGIYALYNELKKIGTVTVVAPDSEKSSVGHGISLIYPIWCKRVKREGMPFGYGITGTPADCVKLAVAVLMEPKPDLVVSGINLGPNDGCSVFYSGTVAGAREGAMLNIPSMAVSLATFVNPDFRYAAKFAAKLAKMVMRNKIPKGTFLNANVPNLPQSKIRGVRITRQGVIPVHGTFTKRRDPHSRDYYWMKGTVPLTESDNNIDTDVLAQNYITVTPIQCDTTDYKFLTDLGTWKIS
ncbi:MAG: 5'/3'-nucleotidase SurE [Candidatus Omnitrophota bacterium]